MDLVLAALATLPLAAAHLGAPLLSFVNRHRRGRLLSAGGGVAVAYVFVHLLPEVAAAQAAVDESASGPIAGIERHAYVMALVGLAVFYGLERAAIRSKDEPDPAPTGRRRPLDAAPARSRAGGRQGDGPDHGDGGRVLGDDVDHRVEGVTSIRTFWVGTASFAVYNAVIGFLVAQRVHDEATLDALLFAAALSVHFVVNDLAMRYHHQRRYDRYGRPILVTSVVAGALLGATLEVSEAALGLAVAFVAGAVVLNVLKEELPEERASRFWAFAAGAAVYTGLLLLVS